MGTLYLVATPIGNLEDMSPRAVRILREARLIAAEDTRHSGKLLKHFGIETQLTSYFEHNKLGKLDRILAALVQGDVALISDAGTPAINDPGYELVRAALDTGIDVRPIPGPSAPLAALAASGLPTDSFLYLGYLPHKTNERKKMIREVSSLRFTLLFLESPHRIMDALQDLLSELGDRQICVAREMTKLFEEYWRGPLSGALTHFSAQPARGEFTLVVQGQVQVAQKWSSEDLHLEIERQQEAGKSARDISAGLVGSSGWSKKEIYALILHEK